MAIDVLWEGMHRGIPTRFVDDDGTVRAETITEGLLSNIASGLWGFAKAHPIITTLGAMSAVDAIKKYKEARDKSVRFYANDGTERTSMQHVVDQMVKSGYKIVTQKYKGASGYEWQLEKKK